MCMNRELEEKVKDLKGAEKKGWKGEEEKGKKGEEEEGSYRRIEV